MPLVEVRISDLEDLIGKRLPLEALTKYIVMLKGEIEHVEGDILEYEATHDRPDLFSAEGLARAIKGLAEISPGLRRFDVREGDSEVLVNKIDYRPYVACAIVRNVVLTEEAIRQLMQLQEKLHMTYGRKRKKVSIGMYDLDKIDPPVYYKAMPKEEIRFVPLDMERELTADEILRLHPKGIEYGDILRGKKHYPILVDSQGVVLSMPPIINSEDTKVTVKTRDVFIDTTGTSLNDVLQLLTIITTSIVERAPEGYIETIKLRYPDGNVIMAPQLNERHMKLEVDYVNETLGLNLSMDEVSHYLAMMRFGTSGRFKDTIEVIVPSYRLDVLHPIDLVEEVAMAYDYERLIPELPKTHVTIGSIDPLEFFSRKVRDIMIGLGFQEVLNYMLSSKELLVHRMRRKAFQLVEVENPVSERFSVLRDSLLPGLLYVFSMSKGYGYPQRIFEVGDVAIIDPSKENRVREERHLSAAIASSKVTLVDALVVLNSLARSLGVPIAYAPPSGNRRLPSFIEGRCGLILLEGREELGVVGEIHPEVIENFGLTVPIAAFEINLDKLLMAYEKIHAS